MSLRSAPIRFGSSVRPFYFRERSSDEVVIKQIFVDQHYDLSWLARGPDLRAFLKERTVQGSSPLIVDAGANIGASPLYFLTAFPVAQVVAVEPDDGNFEILSKNVEGTGVETIRAAVASRVGPVRLVDPGRGHWAYRTEAAEGQAGTIPCVTIGSIYGAHPECFPFLVKIDIEGAEGELFSANTEWVASTPVIVIELHDWLLPRGRTSQSFLRCISELNRDFVYRGENVFSIANDL